MQKVILWYQAENGTEFDVQYNHNHINQTTQFFEGKGKNTESKQAQKCTVVALGTDSKVNCFSFYFLAFSKMFIVSIIALIMEKSNKNCWWIIWLILLIDSVLPIINPYYGWWQQKSKHLKWTPIGIARHSKPCFSTSPLPSSKFFLVLAPKTMIHKSLQNQSWSGCLPASVLPIAFPNVPFLPHTIPPCSWLSKSSAQTLISSGVTLGS